METTTAAVETPPGAGTADRLAAAALRPARTVVRWGVRHGLPAMFLDRSARRGDPVGRLLRDPAVREEPYAVHEELRARGPLVGSSLGLVTHVARGRLRGPALRPLRRRVGPLRRTPLGPVGAALRRRTRRDRRGRAAVDARRRPARPHPLPAAGQPGFHPPRHRRVRAGRPAHRRRAARRARTPRRPGRPGRDLRRAAARPRHRRPARRARRAPRGLPALGRRRGRDPRPRPALPALRVGRAGAAGHARVPARALRAPAPRTRATTWSAAWSDYRATRR